MLEFGSFLRAVNDRPYEWMTMGCLEFDGDCHTSVRYFIAMTVLFDALASLCKFQFTALRNDTERVRLGTKTDHVRHDLAARPAGKFQLSTVNCQLIMEVTRLDRYGQAMGRPASDLVGTV